MQSRDQSNLSEFRKIHHKMEDKERKKKENLELEKANKLNRKITYVLYVTASLFH